MISFTIIGIALRYVVRTIKRSGLNSPGPGPRVRSISETMSLPWSYREIHPCEAAVLLRLLMRLLEIIDH